MSDLWVRNPGSDDEYGPVSLKQLRGMVAAGLIMENTRVRDEYSDSREIMKWPELLAALLDEQSKVWRPGSLAMNAGARRFDIAGDPSADAPAGDAERNSPLKLGRAVFTPTSDAARSVEVPEVLAINRAHEPDKPLKMPPWWRYPFVRNLARWLGLALPVLAICAWWLSRNELQENPFFGVPLVALTGMVVYGWGYMVWVVSPARWDGMS